MGSRYNAANDPTRRHPIRQQAREILTNPEMALAAGPTAVSLALYIEATAPERSARQFRLPSRPGGFS